jgi:endogenous inhibitor of DNA gyrase (YacG/DUF329 family)
MTTSQPPGPGAGKCSICGRPAVQAYRPFCSRRCADVDLARWLRGTYAIPDLAESKDGETTADASRSDEDESRKEKS